MDGGVEQQELEAALGQRPCGDSQLVPVSLHGAGQTALWIDVSERKGTTASEAGFISTEHQHFPHKAQRLLDIGQKSVT